VSLGSEMLPLRLEKVSCELGSSVPLKLDTEMLRFGESGILQKGGYKKTSGTDFEDVKTYLDH